MANPKAAGVSDRFPPQIKYIIGNEGCERFSFYGMKNTLTFFLITYLHLTESTAKANYHLFVSACYFFPLFGGYLADRFLGKYHTIFWLSLFYCLGHACLAVFDTSPTGFYVGLGLIALGAGGIKPCVAAMVGDQFTESNKHLVKRVFALFYWIINFGSFFASLLIPKTLKWFGASVAFGIPGVLMLIATIILWVGRRTYVRVPPTGTNPHSFTRVVWDALRAPKPAHTVHKNAMAHWLDRAAGKHPTASIEGAKAVLRVMSVFATIPVFWALFDQKGSTWIVQATKMDLTLLGLTLEPSQLMSLNPLMVMILIPFNGFVLYPAIERAGFALTPLRRMTLGMFVASLAFLAVGALQIFLDTGATVSVLWQAVPYLLITLAEVLVSTTGLEFAYSQAPREMKGTIMSFWNLTVTFGNLITAGVSALNIFDGAGQYFFFAALILAASVVFGFIARRYVVVDFYQSSSSSAAAAPAGTKAA